VLWQDTNVSEDHVASIFRDSITQGNNPEDLDLNLHLLKNLKSCNHETISVTKRGMSAVACETYYKGP
jgi:hypothetical protein